MNIIHLKPTTRAPLKEAHALYDKMQHSLKNAHVDFEKSIRIAKTLAPILNDQSSNDKHVRTINSNQPLQEKVIAVLMLGFPQNRSLLPTLQNVLHTDTEALRIAATIAISQMRDGNNNELLCDILLAAHQNEQSVCVKKAIRQALLALDKKAAGRLKRLLGDD